MLFSLLVICSKNFGRGGEGFASLLGGYRPRVLTVEPAQIEIDIENLYHGGERQELGFHGPRFTLARTRAARRAVFAHPRDLWTIAPRMISRDNLYLTP